MLKYVKTDTKLLVVFLCIFVLVISIYIFTLCSIKRSIWKSRYRNMEIDLSKISREASNLEEVNSLKLGDIYYFRLSNYAEKNKKDNIKVEKVNDTDEENNITETQEVNTNKSNNWRIKIPRLNLDAPIYEGTSLEVMSKSVGHFEISSRWNGNVGLAAHNRGYKCNFFEGIKKLEKGDKIIYCTEEGERTYEVVINEVIKETDWKYIEQTDDNRITLITCEENKREYRRCIQGVEIK